MTNGKSLKRTDGWIPPGPLAKALTLEAILNRPEVVFRIGYSFNLGSAGKSRLEPQRLLPITARGRTGLGCQVASPVISIRPKHNHRRLCSDWAYQVPTIIIDGRAVSLHDACQHGPGITIPRYRPPQQTTSPRRIQRACYPMGAKSAKSGVAGAPAISPRIGQPHAASECPGPWFK